MVKVRLLQVESNDSESVETRIERVLADIPEHAAATDFLVLPELWHVGAFNLNAARDFAQPHDGPLITALSDIAASTTTWIHAGSVAVRAADGTTTNTSLVFSPAGQLVGEYKKQHLFGFADGERTVMTAGDEYVVIDTPLGETGLATCYDLRFPELFRALTDRSAQTFLICAVRVI
jgi:predicted amidohydrolase